MLLGVFSCARSFARAAFFGPGTAGLTAPQLARRLTLPRCLKGVGGAPLPGPNLVPSMCMGAALLVTADWASQRAFGADELPVGVVTGVLGGVYLLWLLVTERKAGRI